jgi:hypothetical protein
LYNKVYKKDEELEAAKAEARQQTLIAENEMAIAKNEMAIAKNEMAIAAEHMNGLVHFA